MRIDKYLSANNHFDSREKAQQAIIAGSVKVNGITITQPSHVINESDKLEIKPNAIKYVSKGGLKLEKALDHFSISLRDKIIIDVGASTGGFTDCALQNGAAKIYAIDVGTLQLHSSLLNNPKVISLENTDIRNINPSDIGNGQADCLLADVSFISLTKVLPVFSQLIKDNAHLLLLVKPQFETGVKKNFKKGIIKDENTRKEALSKIIDAAKESGFRYKGSIETDADGKNKNIEYMAWFTK